MAAPIVINSISDLQAIQNNPSAYYVLGADIDASGFNFASIANFSGILDGQGHSINNLQVSLFTKIDTQGTVENLQLANVHASGAALAFENDGTVLASSVSGIITGNGITGGLVANNLGSITGSYSIATVTSG